MDASHLWLPYRQMKTAPAPQVVTRTDGVRLYLADGRELIDGVASWWTACHGYNHPHIREAVAAQLERMPHVMLGGLVHLPAAELARRLAALLPSGLDHVFFSESGSVAVEVAMKIALQYRFNRGEPARTRFVSFQHGYHGDTFMTMSVCDPEEGMDQLFGDVLPRQLVLPLPPRLRWLPSSSRGRGPRERAHGRDPGAARSGGRRHEIPFRRRRSLTSPTSRVVSICC